MKCLNLLTQISKSVLATVVSVEVSVKVLCPLANVIDNPDKSFCHWSLRLIYCTGSPADCFSRWFFLLGFSDFEPGSWHGCWSNVPCTGCWVPRCRDPRAADTEDWVTSPKTLFVACLEVLIQKEARNSCLVFRWKSAMQSKKQLKVPWNSECLVMPE